jgi:spermidine/putrescine transport system substrate-binding protein
MIAPFEMKFHVKVNYKTFVGDDQMFALLTQSRSTYDVVVVDPEYISKLVAAGRLAALNPLDYNFDHYLEPFRHFPLAWIDGTLYAVIVRFGSNGLLYNTDHLSPADVTSYDALWTPQLTGRIGIWDWYLPSMGVLSLAIGNTDPYAINAQRFADLKARLFALRPQVVAFYSTPTEMMSSLANGSAWAVPAGGDWMAATLEREGYHVDWTIPREGGIMWSETLAIPNDAPHPDIAKAYIQWMQTPSAQALLSQRQAYSSDPVNALAYELIPAQEKDFMKVHDASEALALIHKLFVRNLPTEQPESAWQSAWQAFKAR